MRAKLDEARAGRRRAPEALRREAAAFAKAEHAAGRSYKSIAAGLGMKPETLMRWCRASSGPKFAPVVVKPATQEGLTRHGPAGTRIDQLSLQQAAELLRALSCSG